MQDPFFSFFFPCWNVCMCIWVPCLLSQNPDQCTLRIVFDFSSALTSFFPVVLPWPVYCLYSHVLHNDGAIMHVFSHSVPVIVYCLLGYTGGMKRKKWRKRRADHIVSGVFFFLLLKVTKLGTDALIHQPTTTKKQQGSSFVFLEGIVEHVVSKW